MRPPEKFLLDFITQKGRPAGRLLVCDPGQAKTLSRDFASLGIGTGDLGRLLALTAYLSSAFTSLIDQCWLLTQGQQTQAPLFQAWIESHFASYFKPVSFLKDMMRDSSVADLRRYGQSLESLTSLIVRTSQELSIDKRRDMGRALFQEMDSLLFWTAQQAALPDHDENFSGPDLSRTFDVVDQFLGLDYSSDLKMPLVTEGLGERLYPGAGLGVQTSYATLLGFLRELRAPPMALLIDLGSGYGRLGFAVGFLCPQLRFVGYEYVKNRVLVAAQAARSVGLGTQVQFFCQDLCDPNFKIPSADIYYMYDPFCPQTYALVLQQIEEVAKHQALRVVTKGDAAAWLTAGTSKSQWQVPLSFEHGNLQIFTTPL